MCGPAVPRLRSLNLRGCPGRTVRVTGRAVGVMGRMVGVTGRTVRVTGRTVGVTGRTVTVILLRFAGRWLLYCCTRGHAGLGFRTPDPNYPPGLPQRGGKQVPTDPDLTDDCLGAAGLGSCGLRGGRGREHSARVCRCGACVFWGVCAHTRWGGCRQAPLGLSWIPVTSAFTGPFLPQEALHLLFYKREGS